MAGTREPMNTPQPRPSPPAPDWPAPPASVAATKADVHIWLIDLDISAAEQAAYRSILTAEELKRADRFVFDYLTRRNIAGQAALRLILSRYTGRPAKHIQFFKGPKGKPYLSPELEATPLQFNVSNSGERALIAVTQEAQVGIDLEGHREVTYGDSVARRHFSPAEYAQLPRVDNPQWLNHFFNCWTRKEAFIKVTGEGLSRALDSFEVSLVPGHRPALTRVDQDLNPERKWTLSAFDPGPGYTAAIVVGGAPRALSFWRFPHGTHQLHSTAG